MIIILMWLLLLYITHPFLALNRLKFKYAIINNNNKNCEWENVFTDMIASRLSAQEEIKTKNYIRIALKEINEIHLSMRIYNLNKQNERINI